MAKLNKLEQLVLNNQHITGTIPEWIGELTALRDLSLTINYFRGSLPRTLGDLRHLIRFKAFEQHSYTKEEMETKKLRQCKLHSKTRMDGPDPRIKRQFKCYPHGQCQVGSHIFA